MSQFDLENTGRIGRCATALILCCADVMRRRWRRSKCNSRTNGLTPSQTVGPYFSYGLTLERPI